MKFKLCGTYPDGTEDSIIIESDTIEDIRQQAQEIVETRNWSHYWSESIH